MKLPKIRIKVFLYCTSCNDRIEASGEDFKGDIDQVIVVCPECGEEFEVY